MTSAREALLLASEIGGYFEVEFEPAPADGWTTFATLIGDAALLREQVGTLRAGLAAQRGIDTDVIETRTAASVWFLATVSRLLSPVFGALVLGGVVPRCAPDSVLWRVDGPRLHVALPDVGADALQPAVIDTVVAPLVDSCVAAFRVSPRVLWGNVASALAGAAVVLDAVRPAARPTTRTQLRAALELGPLAGTGRVTPGGFVRNSCCLIYRVPRGGYCADCVLLDRPA